jgi:RimJ/RimL family protein N-acetyltransferase
LSEAKANCLKAKIAFEENRDHRVHLFLKEPMTFIGSSGLHDIDWSVPKAEIGYWIRTPYGGRGYVTEAVREITRFALEDLGMNRVEIRMSSRNGKSRAVAERLGFTFEGTLRSDARHVDGTLRDTCIYALVREAV